MSRDERASAWLLGNQRGVLSRAQAFSLGVSDNGLQYRARPGGPWQRLLPGVYLTVTGEPSWDQLQTAAMLYARAPCLITGPAALRNYRIRAPDSGKIDLLVPATRQRSSCGFAEIHRTRRMPSTEICDLALRFAPVARAVADTARVLDKVSDVRAVVAAAVQQRRCTVRELAAELAQGPARGSAKLRVVLAEVADGIRSVPEGDLRNLINSSGLPRPLYNASLFVAGRLLAKPDAWWPQAGVVAEVDSREWHLLPEDWAKSMDRHDRMTAAGILVLHFSPRKLRNEPRVVLAAIAAALRSGRLVPGITTVPAA